MLNMGGIQYLQFNQELFVQLSKIHVYILDKKKTKKGEFTFAQVTFILFIMIFIEL